MEEATFLIRFARSVTIVHRRAEFRAPKIMFERAVRTSRSAGGPVLDENGRVSGLRLRDAVTGEKSVRR
jgi:thioredoxin reductase (NADPH)